MGMPIIKPGEGSCKQAVTDLMESIALQETALAHILNAEGEKMQAFIASDCVTPKELLELNCSVVNLIEAVTKLEEVLQQKLKTAICGIHECDKMKDCDKYDRKKECCKEER